MKDCIEEIEVCSRKYIIFALTSLKRTIMEKNIEKPEEKASDIQIQEQEPKTEKKMKKRVSKTLEAARRLKGRLIVNDPKFLL